MTSLERDERAFGERVTGLADREWSWEVSVLLSALIPPPPGEDGVRETRRVVEEERKRVAPRNLRRPIQNAGGRKPSPWMGRAAQPWELGQSGEIHICLFYTVSLLTIAL